MNQLNRGDFYLVNSLRQGKGNAHFLSPAISMLMEFFHCSTYIGVSEVVIVRYFVFFIRFQGAEGTRYFLIDIHKV